MALLGRRHFQGAARLAFHRQVIKLNRLLPYWPGKRGQVVNPLWLLALVPAH